MTHRKKVLLLATALFCAVRGPSTLRAETEALSPQPANARRATPKVSIEFLVLDFAPADRAYDEIYGGGAVYALDLGVSIARHLDVWAGTSRIAREGQLTYTRESTEMSVVRVGAGLRYRIGDRRIAPYAGLGLGWFFLREENPLGRVSHDGPGLVAHTGALVNLHRHLAFDLRVSYLRCSMKPRDFQIQLGGFEIGAGVVLRF